MQVIQLATLHPSAKQQGLEQVKTTIKRSMDIGYAEAQCHTQPAETDPGVPEKHRQQSADIPPVVGALDVVGLSGFLCFPGGQQIRGSVGRVYRARSNREAQLL